MKLVASRQLDGYPASLATVADEVVVLMFRDGVAFLEAYDAHLAPRWSQRLEASAVALLTVNGTPWVLDPEGAWACGKGGECLARVKVRPREGMRLAAFGPADDGFVFAWEHDLSTPMRSPILERVDLDGTVRWSVVLDREPRPADPWTPDTWFTTSETLTVSGDAVLVCFSEMPSTGFGYVVSLVDGALRFTTQRGVHFRGRAARWGSIPRGISRVRDVRNPTI